MAAEQTTTGLARKDWPTMTLTVFGLAGAYALAARLSLQLTFVNSSVSPVWPPTGIAIAALLLLGLRAWPGVFLGALAANWMNGTPLAVSLAIGAGNTLEAVTAAFLVLRFAQGTHSFDRPDGIVRFGAAAAVASALAAIVGAAALTLGGLSPWAEVRTVWTTWWLGDAVGALVVAPLIVLWALHPHPGWRARRLEAAALLACTLVIGMGFVAGIGDPRSGWLPIGALVIAPVAWAAFRFGSRDAVTVSTMLTALAVWGTLQGHGPPLLRISMNDSLLVLQVFIGVITATSLALAAIVGQRDRSEMALRRAHDELQLNVNVRTAQLQEVLGRFRIITDGSPLGIFHTDAAGRVDYANARWHEISGCLDIAEETIRNAVHAEDRQAWQMAWQACLRSKTGIVHEFRFSHPGRDDCRVALLAAPLHGPTGQVVGYSGYIEDITERRAAEQALRESEERNRLLIDSAKDYTIYMLDPQGLILTWNKSGQRIKGYTAEEVIGTNFERFFTPEERAAGAPANELRMAEAKGRHEAEGQRVRKDGTRFWAETTITALRDEAGRLRGFAKVTRDITERKRVEAQNSEMVRLSEVNEFKEGFLRNAAHELGTPLTPLKIQMSLLKNLVHAQPGTTEAKTVAILDRNIERLHALVRDMLEAARVQSGRLPLKVQPMDMAHAIHDVADTFQEAALQGGIHLDVAGPAHVPLMADPERVSQVLYNLVSNAMKFTPKGGSIMVETRAGADACVTVRDTGAGLTAEQAARLFQPFVQVHDIAVRDPGGSGLGLYISKGIVEAHGGTIAVHSAGPGKGCAFTFNLPKQPHPAADVRQEVRPRPAV